MGLNENVLCFGLFLLLGLPGFCRSRYRPGKLIYWQVGPGGPSFVVLPCVRAHLLPIFGYLDFMFFLTSWGSVMDFTWAIHVFILGWIKYGIEHSSLRVQPKGPDVLFLTWMWTTNNLDFMLRKFTRAMGRNSDMYLPGSPPMETCAETNIANPYFVRKKEKG